MGRSPLILLPPSEGKASGGSGPRWAGCHSTPELDAARLEVIASLRAAMRGSAAHRQKLLGVAEAAARAATATNRNVEESPTMPAIERYTGVLYDSLEAGSLPARDRQRMDARVLIFTGLWGVVSPSDMIPDYKLKMGATLPRLGRLSTWWRERLDPVLNELTRSRVVWDLRPNEHAAAWRIGGTPARTIEVKFLEERPGRGLVTLSHSNKLLKGVLTRQLVTTPNPSLESLEEFNFDGFAWDPDSTVDSGTSVTTSVVRRI